MATPVVCPKCGEVFDQPDIYAEDWQRQTEAHLDQITIHAAACDYRWR